MKNLYIKKGFVFVTIILFVALSVSQIINANVTISNTYNQNKHSQKSWEGRRYRLEHMINPLQNRRITKDGNIKIISISKWELLAEQTQNYEEDLPFISTYIGNGTHPPISIEGNDNFIPENGVTDGIGTQDNPYIIDDWIIVGNGTASEGILINNTNAFFIIRNCTITQFKENHFSGIKFNNVENGNIDDSDCFGNYYGISIYESSYITINNSKSYDNIGWYARSIFCYHSLNITITSCKCYNNSGMAAGGIELWGTSYSHLEGIRCYNNEFFGIDVSSYTKKYPVEYITIKNCIVYNNIWGGISMGSNYRSKPNHNGHFHIDGCEIYKNGHVPEIDNAFPGIEIGNANYIIIENCNIHHNGWGIQIDLSSNNIIRNCSVHHNWEPGFLGVGISPGGWIIGLMFSRNNTIENCDIYGNPIGIWLDDTFKATVKYNNISHNNVTGIQSHAWNLLTTARINQNNICGNGWQYQNYSWGITAMRSILNIQNNWWGAEDGPHTKFHSGNGDYLEWRFSVLIKRPWEQKPIPYAGIQP